MGRGRGNGATPKGADGKAVDDGAPSANRDHNMKARAEIMMEVAAGLDRVDDERKLQNEEARELRKRLKENGISKAEFEYMRRLRTKEPDDIDNTLDNLREAARALLPGQQGKLFPNQDETAQAGAGGEDDDVRPGFLASKTADKDAADEAKAADEDKAAA